MVNEIEVDSDQAKAAAADPALLATDLADYLVLRGLPFRRAHEVIGKLVAYSLTEKRGFAELDLCEFQRFSLLFGPDVFSVLNVDRSLEKRTAVGAPSPDNLNRELSDWEARLNG
jgi:argininosuccinate lyase